MTSVLPSMYEVIQGSESFTLGLIGCEHLSLGTQELKEIQPYDEMNTLYFQGKYLCVSELFSWGDCLLFCFQRVNDIKWLRSSTPGDGQEGR